jgi:hypothetical protein
MEKRFAIPGSQIRDLVSAPGGCFITDRVTIDGFPIGYMYREEADHPADSGWRFFAGDETEEYIDDAANTAICAVNTAANYDPDIIPFLDTPAPCAFEKVGRTYLRVEAPSDAA